MADEKYIEALRQDVNVWNKWRKAHADVTPDLRNVDLSGVNLSGANFQDADLYGANLSDANLIGADLIGTDLIGANLSRADLSGAYLTGATLVEANLTKAILTGSELKGVELTAARLVGADLTGANLELANLSGNSFSYSGRNRIYTHLGSRGADLSAANLRLANLVRADLSATNLNGADLSLSRFGRTGLGEVNLSSVKGLETVRHDRYSYLDIHTLYLSHGNIPEAFMRGVGAPDIFIEYARSLIGSSIEYYSCFISYSSKDEAFAKRLYADLQSNNIRCWFAPEDLKWGESIGARIDEAIRLHEKLLLILSKHSLASGWVEREVKIVLARERAEKRIVLFPVRIDKAILESSLPWASEIRDDRNIGDFTRWKSHDAYQQSLDRLLRDLKAEAL